MSQKPTGRVVALIVLMIFVAAALRGYLPTPDHAAPTEGGSGRAVTVFVIAALSGTVALLVIAVIARLRDPHAALPRGGDPSGLLGTDDKGRPNWRVILIGLAVIVAWLLILMLLVRLLVPPAVPPTPLTRAPTAPPSVHTTGPPPQHHPQNSSGDMVGILLASTIAMLLVIVAGSVIVSRRRWRATTPATNAGDFKSPTPEPRSESLVRAAEVGLAEIGDLNREPREAIIACYAAMERELANVPGAVPQDFDTPTEVLVRAVEHHALHVDNAAQLVNLFEEARFSPHVMNEGHRKMAVNVLRLVLAELRSPV
jgi:Domain of unknown function (DUF4129)